MTDWCTILIPKVILIMVAIMVASGSPDDHYHQPHYGHHQSHHQPHYGHHHGSYGHKPYYFDYKAHDYYGGSYHHTQESDGYNKKAEFQVYYPDGKSTLKFKIGGKH